MNFSTTLLEIQITPALLYRIRPISTSFARHVRNELCRRSNVCPPNLYRPLFTITCTSHLPPSMTCGRPVVHSPDGKGRTIQLLNLSRGRMHSTWRVTKRPTKTLTNHRKMILAASLRSLVFVTLLLISCSMWIS
jgi:hypothetical protein